MVSILNNYFNKLQKLNNNFELEFNDELYIQFNKYLINYNVNKNSKITNSKVYFILKLNLRNELNNLNKQYINACLNNEDIEISNNSIYNILIEAKEYIKYKYDKYINEHPKFKIISDIEKKYNIVNKDIITITGSNDEDEKIYNNLNNKRKYC